MSKLKKNLVFNVTYQLLILFLPLVTSSYLARIVGADGIGRYSYAYSIALYFTYFTVLGLDKYGNRMIASAQRDRDARSKNFWEIYSMQVICFVFCCFAYLIYSLFFSKDRSIAVIQTIFVLSSLFDINWFFFGMEMFDKTVIRNTIVKVTTTLLIIFLVKTKEDVEKYAIIMSVGYLCSQLALWPYLPKYVCFKKVKWNNIKQHILPNLTMFLPVIAISVYKIMDKIMLGMMTTKAVVGYYENAEKIVNVPIAVIAAFGTVMLPRITALISENKDNEVAQFRDLAVMIITALSSGACFGIIGISDSLSLWMWGKDFEISGVVMKYLSITLLFLGIGNVIRTQFLIPYKHDKIYIFSAFLGAVVNIVLNTLLIPHYGAIGAAIGTICAEVMVCLYQLIMVKNNLPLRKYAKDMLLFCVAGAVMLFVILIIPSVSSGIINLLIHVLVGAVVYTLITIPFVYKKIMYFWGHS